MYTLTERRFEKIKPILETHRERFLEVGWIDTGAFERELRDTLDTGYQELKQVALSLSKMPRYQHIAAYYMQNQNATGPVSEFKDRLAELYGTKTYDHFDSDGKRKKFWERATKKSTGKATKPAKK